jgi:uncharacterized membrane protein YhaH (DUF805 family)
VERAIRAKAVSAVGRIQLSLLTIARWVLVSALTALFVLLSIANARIIVRRLRGIPSPSWLPLLGGLAGLAAVLLEPNRILVRVWWLPLLLDAGSVPGLLWTAIWHFRRLRKLTAGTGEPNTDGKDS